MSMLVTFFYVFYIATITIFLQHPSSTSMLPKRDGQRCKNRFISMKYYGDIERAYWRPLTDSSRTSSQSSIYWEWWPSKVNWGHLESWTCSEEDTVIRLNLDLMSHRIFVADWTTGVHSNPICLLKWDYQPQKNFILIRISKKCPK